ncbi:tRNA (N(6)-L-threonylcarbamoyladenosine(37)-C(2))-methylthiotransferase [Candidatus Woesearchaeota archaeon]|nr:tRNA (N(6)-L-threonylcarbamoyladenosine(37)-C(2))-methylthiotransferase [Candidatus Woesearchaeota archaeon]
MDKENSSSTANKKVFFYTQGCANNQTDSETMAGILKEDGYDIVNAPESADCLVINSCTVKNATETEFFRTLNKLPKKPTVVAGCIAQTDQEKLKGFSLIGTTNIHHITDVVEETLEGNQVIFTKRENSIRLNLPKIRKNPVIEIIPINRGCLGHCTFCKTKAARFNLQSFEKQAILQQAQQAIKEGVKEIWLTSQDTAVYGQDLETREEENNSNNKNKELPELLKALCNLEGTFMVKLGMGNPDHYLKMIPNLIEAFKHKKMFKFLHIPLQAGNNEVLANMERNYTTEEYKYIITEFKKAIPQIHIMTDIICGFPGETDEQFEDTLKIIEETKPDSVNISRYSARPKTVAATWKQLPTHVIADRSRKLTELFDKITLENNEKWIAWEGAVLIDEEGKQGTKTMNGKNACYRQIVVNDPEQKLKLGDIVHVKVIEAKEYYLLATFNNKL